MGGEHPQFGNLYRGMCGIITYRLSPFELKPFHGWFSHGIPRWIRRIQEEFLYVVPPLLLGYVTYDQVEKKHEQVKRKIPSDYENEEEDE